MMARCEFVDAARALDWGLADAVISDGPGGADVDAFLAPFDSCAPQVLRGIKAQAIAARLGPAWQTHRRVEQEHLVRTWLHDDHWAASDKFLAKASA
jgi:enoyl-CoA hydratase